MQVRHIVQELRPPGRQYGQACSVCKGLLSHVIYEIHDRFFLSGLVVHDFIWIACRSNLIPTETSVAPNVLDHVCARCTNENYVTITEDPCACSIQPN
jgi:hypothetical protein